MDRRLRKALDEFLRSKDKESPERHNTRSLDQPDCGVSPGGN